MDEFSPRRVPWPLRVQADLLLTGERAYEPLDRVLDRFPGAREVLLRLDEYLPFIVVGALVLVFFWAFVAGPRRAGRILKGLEKEGYGPVDAEDPQLKEALERLTPIIFHTYGLSTVTKTSPWRVKLAFARDDGRKRRYYALINRSVSRAARASTILEHQFTIAFLESRVLPFNQTRRASPREARCDVRFDAGAREVVPPRPRDNRHGAG